MLEEQALHMPIQTPRGEAILRPALPSDLPAYREIRLEALKNHPDAYTSDYAVCLAWPLEKWAERLGYPAGWESKVTFLAEAGGLLAAMGGVFRGESPRTAHTATVVGIYTRPGWRGLRLSEALLQMCERWAALAGVSILKLAVMSTNIHAVQIYLRCGYRVYGIDPHSWYSSGKYLDEILMIKELAPLAAGSDAAGKLRQS